jgi:hypothetical protein
VSNAAICIGGSMDGVVCPQPYKALPLSPIYEYTLHRIELGGTAPLLVYVHNSLTTTAAVHMVFAAYAKKGKK